MKPEEIETHPARVRWYEAGRQAGVAEGLRAAVAFLEKHRDCHRDDVLEELRALAAEEEP